MKSKFWASVIAMVVTSIFFVFIWFFNGKPVEITRGEGMAISLAFVALYESSKNELLRKEE